MTSQSHTLRRAGGNRGIRVKQAFESVGFCGKRLCCVLCGMLCCILFIQKSAGIGPKNWLTVRMCTRGAPDRTCQSAKTETAS